MKPFTKVGEQLIYEGIEVENILYLLKRNTFVAATVAMYNDYIDGIVKLFRARYGESKVIVLLF